MLQGDPIRKMGHQGQLGMPSRSCERPIYVTISYPAPHLTPSGWFGRRINPTLTTEMAVAVSQDTRYALRLKKRGHEQLNKLTGREYASCNTDCKNPADATSNNGGPNSAARVLGRYMGCESMRPRPATRGNNLRQGSMGAVPSYSWLVRREHRPTSQRVSPPTFGARLRKQQRDWAPIRTRQRRREAMPNQCCASASRCRPGS